MKTKTTCCKLWTAEITGNRKSDGVIKTIRFATTAFREDTAIRSCMRMAKRVLDSPRLMSID